MKHIFLLIVIFSIITCNSVPDSTKEQSIDTNLQAEKIIIAEERASTDVSKDSLKEEKIYLEKKIDSLSEISNFFIPFNKFPIIIDSLFIETASNTKEKKLHRKDMLLLSTNPTMLNSDLYTSQTLLVKRAMELDSFERVNKLEEFLDSIPTWDIQYTECYALNKFKLGETNCFLWLISYSTGEGCPYSSGSDIFITFEQNNQPLISYKIGEEEDGGDPPSWVYNSLYAKIEQDGTFSIKSRMIETGENESGQEDTIMRRTNSFLFQWNGKKLLQKE